MNCDYSALEAAINALTAVLSGVFGLPDSADLAAVWAVGFVIPMAAGIGGFAVGAIRKMFEDAS